MTHPLTADSPAPAHPAGFSSYVAEKLGWYVYLLRDPRDGQVFYVGKGTGNRVFAHEAVVRKDLGLNADGDLTADYEADEADVESSKNTRIRDIVQAGMHVEHLIARHGLSSDEHAYDVEAALIDVVSAVRPQPTLTNIMGGHHSDVRGLMSAVDAMAIYEAPAAPPIDVPAILFRIPLLWYPAMPPQELFLATRGWWRLGARREKARYAFAVSKGVIRAVYRIDTWRPRRQGDLNWEEDPPGKPKWGFEGEPADEMAHYLNCSLAHMYKKGEQGPFKYVNC